MATMKITFDLVEYLLFLGLDAKIEEIAEYNNEEKTVTFKVSGSDVDPAADRIRIRHDLEHIDGEGRRGKIKTACIIKCEDDEAR